MLSLYSLVPMPIVRGNVQFGDEFLALVFFKPKS